MNHINQIFGQQGLSITGTGIYTSASDKLSERYVRAFVKETAESAPPPERMVEAGPNLVTPEGFAAIEGQVARLESELAKLARDASAPEHALASETLARISLAAGVHQRA